MKKVLIILLGLISAFENNIIKSGPMVGYTTRNETAIWIQTVKSSNVKFSYWDINEPKKKYYTDNFTTKKESSFTVTVIITNINPGTTYHYSPIINDTIIDLNYDLTFQTQEHWEFRIDPPDFSFAAGSCAYTNDPKTDRPGKPYGKNYFIYDSILKKKPNFMLWLGDNVYFRETEWESKTGIYNRYTFDRSLNELQPLLASVNHYAIWDDHDYGPNNSNRSFIGKHISREAFKDFWANPSYGINGKGITTKFSWSDVDFFLLDNRFFRSPQKRKNTYKEILGDEQLEWLIDALSFSNATFKIIVIGGQVLNSEMKYENYSNWFDEHKKLLKNIYDEKIEGIIFLSGDRHFSELSKMDRLNAYPLYEFTVSPLTSNYCDICINENNAYRIEESTVFERNFAIFNIKGPKNNRRIDYKTFNSNGDIVWQYIIYANDLKFK